MKKFKIASFIYYSIFILSLFLTSCTRSSNSDSEPIKLVKKYVTAAKTRNYNKMISCYSDENKALWAKHKKESKEKEKNIDKRKIIKTGMEQFLDTKEHQFSKATIGEAKQESLNNFIVIVKNVQWEPGIKGNVIICNLKVFVEKKNGKWIISKTEIAPLE